MKNKFIKKEDEWHKVIKELDSEVKKLESYDQIVFKELGDVKERKILDYGAGPGVFAKFLKDLGADSKVYDVSREMCNLASTRIGKKNVYYDILDIPDNTFDYILCNLVLCIVAEEEVIRIAKIFERKINSNGTIFIGFCNPKIFKIEESNLDFRIPTGNDYKDNHDYKKVKKEGNYQIIEKHRPLEWYSEIFTQSQLSIDKLFFTKEYELKGNRIEDFAIFKLSKGKKY